jgi:hypothetical protein
MAGNPGNSIFVPERRTPMIEFTIAVVGLIPDTEEARKKVRAVVEYALQSEGVALKACLSRYETVEEAKARRAEARRERDGG